jgi:transcriptional regulator with XRE-family HTH domain
MSAELEHLKSALARNIKARRAEMGLAQERLGLDAGVDRTVVSKIERGVANPSLEILFRIAQRLDTPVSSLLADSHSTSFRP